MVVSVSKHPVMKYFLGLIITLLHTFIVIGDGCNITNSRRTRSDEGRYPDGSTKSRYPRLLTFNTEDDGDVTVVMEFAVPFVSIPVKKTIDNIWGLGPVTSIANINVGAIVLAGAMVFGAAVVIPLISTFFRKQVVLGGKHERNDNYWSRSDSWAVDQLIEKTLSENNIDAVSCMQRTVCWLTKSSSNKYKSGQAGSSDMIINGLAMNNWLNDMFRGTALHAAVVAGLANINCSAKYKDCKITQKGILNRIGTFFKMRK